MKEFSGKVALITGAANGFGKALAIEAAGRGMKLALVDIDNADLTGTTAVLRNLGAEVLPIHADVTKFEDVRASVEKTLAAYGSIDLLFCNAGIAPAGDIFHLPPRDWRWAAYSNLVSHGYYMHEVLPVMIKQGTPAHIITTASIAGIVHGIGNNPAYSATKHGAVALAEDIRAFCKLNNIENIGVSVYCPGYVQTDLHHSERHRPERFSAPTDPYYSSPHFLETVARVNVNISTGIPIDSVGKRLFKAVEDNQLYVITHPQYLPYIEARHRKIESDAGMPDGCPDTVPGNYEGQVALITGAASGFGLEFAKSAAKRGMKLALVDINDEGLAAAKRYFDSNNVECVAIRTDVSLYDEVRASVRKTMEAFGRIDVMFCNAGIAPCGSVVSLPPADWEWAVETNILSHAYYYYEVLPIMVKQGTPAKILTTASIAGLVPGFGINPAYSATKHGTVALSESVSMKLKDLGYNFIQVSVYAPGFVQTDLHHSYDHKPARFVVPDDPYYNSTEYAARLKGTEHSIVTGIPLDGVGERLFKGIDGGQKYILTHPQYLPKLQNRHAEIENDIKREKT